MDSISTFYVYSQREGSLGIREIKLPMQRRNLRWPRRSLEIEHWPFDCAKRLHIGDSNLESPISNLLGHRAKRLHIGDSNLESPIS